MMEDLVEPDPLSIKEEQEPELVQVKEEGEFLKIKEEEEEPELAQIKKEEEEPAPFHLKVEEEPEHLHVKKEEEEAEPPQKKEEEEELGISHDEEQPGQKQQADTCMQTLVFKVKDHREQEPSSICLLTENSAETENLKHEGNDDEDSGSSQEDVCCKKCKGLQDTYPRERRKELESRRSGGAAGAVNKWRFSAVLSFLDPFVTARPTTDRVEETAEDLTAPAQDQETSETKETNRDNTQDRSLPAETPAKSLVSEFQVPASSSSAAASTPIGRRRVRPREDPSAVERALLEALQNQPRPPPPPTPMRVFSSNEHFLISLAQSLDRLPPHEQDLLKLQIMKVIVDHSTVVLNLEHLDTQ